MWEVLNINLRYGNRYIWCKWWSVFGIKRKSIYKLTWTVCKLFNRSYICCIWLQFWKTYLLFLFAFIKTYACFALLGILVSFKDIVILVFIILLILVTEVLSSLTDVKNQVGNFWDFYKFASRWQDSVWINYLHNYYDIFQLV